MSPSGDIGVLTTDVSLAVQSWDDWLAAATSIPAGEAHGRPLGMLVPALEDRGLLERFRETIASGIVQVFTSALNGPMIPCAPRTPSRHFELMQQRVTVGPLLDNEQIAGLVITVQDVTAQLDAERELAAALSSGDVDQQRAATDAIAAAPRIESLDSFSPALRSADWRVRRAAVTALASAADQELLRAVLRTLQREHRDFSSLSSALKLLAVTNEDITVPLTELLHDPDADLRIQAALALGEQPSPAAATPLLGALDDPDANVRFHAIEALGRLRSTAAIERLILIAESGDFFLGFAALDALAAIGDPTVAPRMVPLLRQEAFRAPVVRALSELGDERVVGPLVETLNTSPDAASAVIQGLAAIANRLVDEGLDVSALVRASLNDQGRRHLLAAAAGADPDLARALSRVVRWIGGREAAEAVGALLAIPDARAEAAEALVEIGEPAVDVLIEWLDHDDGDLRALAVGALAQIGSRRATPHLVRLLDDPRMAVPAAGALARVADENAFEPLLRLIGHRDPAVRMAAVGALNAIGHPQTQERIPGLLDDDDPLVCESAVRIAGYFGYASATERVRALTSHPHEGVRIAALEHLPFFDEELALAHAGAALTTETPKARAAAVRALARVESSAALPLLERSLQDSDIWVRYFGARAIAERPERTDIPALLTLADTDPSAPVRVAAIEAIGVRRTAVPLAPLVRAAAGDNIDVASAALLTLGQLGGPDALVALRTAMRAPDAPRRKAAVLGLGAAGSRDVIADLEWIAAADPDPSVAECAIRELGGIAARAGEESSGAIDSLVALLAETDRCELATAALTRLPVERLPRLAIALDHPHPTVRRRAVETLARHRHPEATRLIAPAFEDAESLVREAAAAAALRLGTRTYDTILRRLATADPSKGVRRAAAAALDHSRTLD